MSRQTGDLKFKVLFWCAPPYDGNYFKRDSHLLSLLFSKYIKKMTLVKGVVMFGSSFH